MADEVTIWFDFPEWLTQRPVLPREGQEHGNLDVPLTVRASDVHETDRGIVIMTGGRRLLFPWSRVLVIDRPPATPMVSY